ncbi:hypothetical protein [Micromonospora sp. NPDC049679]|uniref:hypothetical protein n=1 Tax=Micromonospora sp. NPDC049679 TaxID=3155920 RepID=UPI0033F4DECB
MCGWVSQLDNAAGAFTDDRSRHDDDGTVYAGLFGDDLDAVAHRLDEAFTARDADYLRTGTGDGTVIDLGKRRSPGQ